MQKPMYQNFIQQTETNEHRSSANPSHQPLKEDRKEHRENNNCKVSFEFPSIVLGFMVLPHNMVVPHSSIICAMLLLLDSSNVEQCCSALFSIFLLVSRFCCWSARFLLLDSSNVEQCCSALFSFLLVSRFCCWSATFLLLDSSNLESLSNAVQHCFHSCWSAGLLLVSNVFAAGQQQR